jgi:hypothetical protein
MVDQFLIGQEASSSAVTAAFEELRSIGESALSLIEQKRINTLVDFDRRLSSLNLRRQRANRANTPRVAANFVVSDLLSVDQGNSSACIRIDTQSVTLRERRVPAAAVVRTTRFSSDVGTVESLDLSSSLFRVHTDNNEIPAGTFTLDLQVPLSLTLLVFDIAAMPSEPSISVQASSNGMTYVDANQVSRNGYRLNAWLNPMEVKSIRLIITPTHPDELGGSSFTFGLTAFNANAIEFHLQSEFLSLPVTFSPVSKTVRLDAPVAEGISYYLALSPNPFVEIQPGVDIAIPGTALVTASGVVIDSTGLLAHTFPGTAYVDSLSVTQDGVDDVTGVANPPVNVAPSLAPADSRVAQLVNKYIGINGANLNYIRDDVSRDVGKTFSFSYITGPSSITAQLKVVLSTSDRAVTPVFRGAKLLEV